MPPTLRVRDEAMRHADRLRRSLGDDLREARLAAGLSQAVVARRLGCAPSSVSRIERAAWPGVSATMLAHHATAVGHVLRMAVYPVGSPLRDAGQLRLLNRLHRHVPTSAWRWILEMPVADGDLRAFDAAAVGPAGRICFDAWTRLRDVQAQVRRTRTKATDANADRLVLVLADTSRNRAAMAEAGEALRRAFPASGRTILAALRAGRLPPSDGIVFL